MTFDDKAIEAAAKRLCIEHGRNPEESPGLWKSYKNIARLILNDAIASMKERVEDEK